MVVPVYKHIHDLDNSPCILTHLLHLKWPSKLFSGVFYTRVQLNSDLMLRLVRILDQVIVNRAPVVYRSIATTRRLQLRQSADRAQHGYNKTTDRKRYYRCESTLVFIYPHDLMRLCAATATLDNLADAGLTRACHPISLACQPMYAI